MKKLILLVTIVLASCKDKTVPADLSYNHHIENVFVRDCYYKRLGRDTVNKYVLLFGITDAAKGWKNDTVFIGDKDYIIKDLYRQLQLAKERESALYEQLYALNGAQIPNTYIHRIGMKFISGGMYIGESKTDSISAKDYYLQNKNVYDSLYNVTNKQ